MPTWNELGIADCNGGAPGIDPIFGPARASFSWSSTDDLPYSAWVVDSTDGHAVPDMLKTTDEFHVRAVRNGP